MLQALGAQFYDDEGRVVDMRQGAGVIKYIRRMDMSNLHPKMETARIQVMSDFQVDYMVSKVKSCKLMMRIS